MCVAGTLLQKPAKTVKEEDGMQEDYFLLDIKIASERRIC
jgi:hypothetical protein